MSLQHGYKLHIADVWTPSLQWEHDAMLMDAYKKEKPSTNTLDYLNRVRLYLGVTTLADLGGDDGIFLESWAITVYERQEILHDASTCSDLKWYIKKKTD
eukprot:5454706-Ditylum_brightwellii.AAC.1